MNPHWQAVLSDTGKFLLCLAPFIATSALTVLVISIPPDDTPMHERDFIAEGFLSMGIFILGAIAAAGFLYMLSTVFP